MSRLICILGLLAATTTGEAKAQVILSPTRYELDVQVDYKAEVLRGSARVVITNLSAQPARQASFLLYRLMRARSVCNDQEKNFSFSQVVTVFDDFGKLQVNQILVTLPEPLAPGAQTAIRIQYEGPLLGYAETGMLYIKDRIDPEFTILRDDAIAYPRPGYPSMAVNRNSPQPSFSYQARITVPKGLTVANGGRLEGTDTHGDLVTFRFSNLKPCWRMDFAIAKYGERSSGSVHIYYLPGDSVGAEGVEKAANTALSLFSKWFGPLRSATTLTFIEIPDGWGSQADVTAVVQSAAAFRDPERHREVYHEISHLWNVPDTDRPSPRWNEGLATFLEYHVTDVVSGKNSVDGHAAMLVDWLRDELPRHPEWRKVPLVEYGRQRMTDLSYWVGALYFDLLYRLVGQETFNKIVGSFTAEFGIRGGSMKDFVDLVQKQTPMDLRQFTADWIYSTRWADRIAQGARISDLEASYRAAGR